ncbi:MULTISPECIES: SSI family serine proteinase inhibitor [unclassified Pseudonocardia]|uniref:SSI family serine proteinase inhibitor n=1 Tax=unclassified Pseudonocardia TaxID=2619320 RepID=UPI00095E39DC|nr:MULTISPECIES: SSI family serine proteinase inhibitor [unclassified Pseudonocardia]MBN9099540.1 hypothetical protein [Pseudonocardia sp.]OJY43622.1 MAG: hypothetical protein BGP03_26065 [Pseudonocardia sp. 73-21]
MRFTAALLLAALVLAACGSTARERSASRLTVTVVDDVGAAPRTWTLTCDPPGGDHPQPAAACAAVDAAGDPFAPKPADVACTEIYGGPQTATIVGTWRGTPVNAGYERTDGCEINRWNTLAAVFGAG